MAILLDSGILYAFYDRRDAWHTAAVDLIAQERGGLGFGALSFLQGLLVVLRDSGHPGLVVVLDEVETLQRVRGACGTRASTPCASSSTRSTPGGSRVSTF